MRHDGHQFTRACMAQQHIMLLAIHTAVDGMRNTIAAAIARMLQKRARERNAHRYGSWPSRLVIHTARHNGFDRTTFKASPKDVSRFGS